MGDDVRHGVQGGPMTTTRAELRATACVEDR
jgi:hypothetical protein